MVLLAVLCLFFSIVLLAAPALAATFTDVYSDTYDNPDYPDAVSVLSDLGVISGFNDGTFRPHDSVTRQQFAKMVVKILGLPVTGNEYCPFTDVLKGTNPNDPFYPDKYIAVCAANGITQGTGPTTFAPYNNITRAQVISMVVRGAQNIGVELESPSAAYYAGTIANSKFRNLTDPNHGYNVQIAEMNNLFWGIWPDQGDNWDIYRKASRGEVAQIMWRLWQKMGSPSATELPLDGPAVSGAISNAGEEDWYQFTVPSYGFYTIDTDAGTLADSVLWLYGPNNQTALIAAADDLPDDSMAQLTLPLTAGTYYVKVTAYGSDTGSYSIRLGYPLYSDDFSDSSLWPTGQTDSTAAWYEGGRYVMSADESWNAYAWRSSWEIDDAIISVEAEFRGVQSSSKYAYGIVARLRSNSSGETLYLFQVDNGRNASIWKLSPSGWTQLAIAPLPAGINPGVEEIILTASLRGSTLAFSVDGTEVVSASSSSYTSGVVGLYVESADGTTEVAFDNMTVVVP